MAQVVHFYNIIYSLCLSIEKFSVGGADIFLYSV